MKVNSKTLNNFLVLIREIFHYVARQKFPQRVMKLISKSEIVINRATNNKVNEVDDRWNRTIFSIFIGQFTRRFLNSRTVYRDDPSRWFLAFRLRYKTEGRRRKRGGLRVMNEFVLRSCSCGGRKRDLSRFAYQFRLPPLAGRWDFRFSFG